MANARQEDRSWHQSGGCWEPERMWRRSVLCWASREENGLGLRNSPSAGVPVLPSIRCVNLSPSRAPVAWEQRGRGRGRLPAMMPAPVHWLHRWAACHCFSCSCPRESCYPDVQVPPLALASQPAALLEVSHFSKRVSQLSHSPEPPLRSPRPLCDSGPPTSCSAALSKLL